MNLLLHFKVNEGDDNNINIQEYKLYGDVEKKYDKCLVDEGNEVVLTEFPVPEFKNCTLMKKGDEGFYEYKDYRQGENAELAGGYAVSGILQQNKRFDFNYVNDQINGIVQDPFYKVETMGDYQIPMRVLDAYNDLYMAALATTEYIYYLHDSDDVLMVGLENRQTIARGEFAMDSYQESFENIYYGNSYEEEIWMDEYEKDAKTQELERPDWMEEDEILIDRDNDYVLLRDPDENVKQIWTASGEFLSTVQLENETVDKAMEEYYHNISKGDIEL